MYTVRVKFPHFRQTKDLETAGIRQNGTFPVSEFVEAAGLAHDIKAGTQIKVITVSQDDFRAESFELFDGEGFDSAVCADICAGVID